jgi:hypothetical protein
MRIILKSETKLDLGFVGLFRGYVLKLNIK